MQTSRLQIWLTILAGFFLLGIVLIFAVFALAPNTALVYRPSLLTAFIVALFVSLVCITWLLRGLLQPYGELIGEAKRAPVAHSGRTQNEAAFVLETFQSVIAQLQTQQKELERLHAQTSQRADSAERFNDRIVASMPGGLIAFDASGCATVINAPAGSLFEIEPPAPGEHFRTIFAGMPALAEMVDACLASGRVFRREEIEAGNGAGQPKRLGATVAPIDPGSEAGGRGVLCLLTDITEVTRLREQVALKRNLESLGEMSAGLAHEFKNSMAALHGYAQLLQRLDQDDQGKLAAEALLQEVRNLTEMITAFLSFARPQPLQLEEVWLDELIEDCARELQPLFEARRVELSIVRSVPPAVADGSLRSVPPAVAGGSLRSVPPAVAGGAAPEPERAQVQADTRMLRQALLNLLRNAVEAISDQQIIRRVDVKISTECERGRPWAMIAVRDSGEGISPTDLPKIFIPFFTTKSHGHGIGLALTHRVITEHGGTLTVGNEPEGGASFTIRLPQ